MCVCGVWGGTCVGCVCLLCVGEFGVGLGE